MNAKRDECGLSDAYRGQSAILLLEVPSSLPSAGESLTIHCVWFHPVEDVEEIVGVASRQSSGERDQSLLRTSEHAQAVALRRVAGELKNVGPGKRLFHSCGPYTAFQTT